MVLQLWEFISYCGMKCSYWYVLTLHNQNVIYYMIIASDKFISKVHPSPNLQAMVLEMCFGYTCMIVLLYFSRDPNLLYS